jgi:hypothetical protein
MEKPAIFLIRNTARLFAWLLITLCYSFSLEAADPTSVTKSTGYPIPDSALGEVLQKGEIEAAQKIARHIEKGLRNRFRGKTMRRDAHPKAHGCVKANFSVHSQLDTSLAKGVFQRGKSYDAWIRFSNGNEDPERPDYEGDGRGMAIKLMGVEGETLLENEQNTGTQDFIMISHPVFLINDSKDYERLVSTVNSDNFFVKLASPILVPFALGLDGTRIALNTTSLRIDNPLKTRYWSMVPYQLGVGKDRKAIKFSVAPCSSHKHNVPENAADDFLREAMEKTLSKRNACMKFMVQLRTDDSLSVENSQVEWPEAQFPFKPVATIDIPQQSFNTPNQNSFCENLSFNPWRALPEHKPLGAINRMRKSIYQHISKARRKFNKVESREPTSFSVTNQ